MKSWISGPILLSRSQPSFEMRTPNLLSRCQDFDPGPGNRSDGRPRTAQLSSSPALPRNRGPGSGPCRSGPAEPGRHQAADSKHFHHRGRSCANIPISRHGFRSRIGKGKGSFVASQDIGRRAGSPFKAGPLTPRTAARKAEGVSHPLAIRSRASPPGPSTWVRATASNPIDLLGTLPNPSRTRSGRHAPLVGTTSSPNRTTTGRPCNLPMSRDGNGSPPCTRHN
jgi:hypothetical protein